MSLLQLVKLIGHEPHANLRDILERLPTRPAPSLTTNSDALTVVETRSPRACIASSGMLTLSP